MSKPKIPVEVQVILQELCIAPADEATLLRKVHTRAALQVKDYLSIIMSKFELNTPAKTLLAQAVDDTRRMLQHVEQGEHTREEHDEADVVVENGA
jgi:hypothetical protein